MHETIGNPFPSGGQVSAPTAGKQDTEITVVPPGFVLRDGRMLTFPAHSECPCADCQEAVATVLAERKRDIDRWEP